MKNLLLIASLGGIFIFSGCASSDTTAKGDPVPGEKIGEDSRLQPGAGSPGSASVKW